MDEPNKMVRFDKYCSNCKYWDEKDEHKDPCDDCLDHPVNWETERPVHYKGRK